MAIFPVFKLKLVFFTLAFLHVSSTENLRPIIGILTEPSSNTAYGKEYIQTSYVKYLELAGARVVAIRGDQPKEYYEKLFKNINGVLFPGGGVDIDKGSYAESGKYMYKMAIEANDINDYFPLWGTCLGLQLLTALTAGKDYLKRTDTNNLTLTLDFEPDFRNSKLLKDVPEELIDILKNEPVTQNEHNWSMVLEDFYNLTALSNFYHLLSTNVGRDNVKFVSTFEAKNYPFYGVQWHPEKNIFYWGNRQVVSHSFNAVKVAQHFANFFVNEARKSNHRYESFEAEANALIDNAHRVYEADVDIPEKFYFNSGISCYVCSGWICVSIICIACFKTVFSLIL